MKREELKVLNLELRIWSDWWKRKYCSYYIFWVCKDVI